VRDDRSRIGADLADAAAWEQRDPQFRKQVYMVDGEDGKKVGRAHPFSAGERNRFFINRGGQYTDVGGISGIDSPADSRAFVYLDYDRDGDHDLVLVNANSPSVQFFQTDVPRPGKFVALRLRGKGEGFSNRSAIGAKVRARLPDGRLLYRELHAGEGFGSQNSKTILLGIGDQEKLRSLEIEWPTGLRTAVAEEVQAGMLVEWTESEKPVLTKYR